MVLDEYGKKKALQDMLNGTINDTIKYTFEYHKHMSEDDFTTITLKEPEASGRSGLINFKFRIENDLTDNIIIYPWLSNNVNRTKEEVFKQVLISYNTFGTLKNTTLMVCNSDTMQELLDMFKADGWTENNE